jgi:hypothetical protein
MSDETYNELLESLLNSDIEENRQFGSLLLNSQEIPEEQRRFYLNKLLEEYMNGGIDDGDTMKNVIEAYNLLSFNLNNRIKKI